MELTFAPVRCACCRRIASLGLNFEPLHLKWCTVCAIPGGSKDCRIEPVSASKLLLGLVQLEARAEWSLTFEPKRCSCGRIASATQNWLHPQFCSHCVFVCCDDECCGIYWWSESDLLVGLMKLEERAKKNEGT